MFKDRSIQVSVVKNQPKEPSDEAVELITFSDRVQIVQRSVEGIGKKVIIGAVIVVGADALRQILVKLTPSR